MSEYIKKSHTLGRLGQFFALIIMLSIPLITMAVYDLWPQWNIFLGNVLSMLIVLAPVNIASVISYIPVLGTGFYIANITGNINSLKLPCAMNAIEMASVSQGTEESDVIATLAIAVSSLMTMLIILVSILFLAPLKPLLTSHAVQIAVSNIIPALFGSLLFTMLMNNKRGHFRIVGQYKIAILPMILVALIHIFLFSLTGKEGFVMLLSIPVLWCSGKFLEKKKKIRFEELRDKNG